MKKIRKILLCGLGAIGGYYASRTEEHPETELKILVDKERLERYKKTPRVINNKQYDFDYVLPEENGYKADLIIIATKSSGLKSAIKNIKNFIGEDSVILSFLNGITSEKAIIKEYGEKVLYSFLLGHTFFRKGKNIVHDGHANIIFGSTKENDINVERVKEFLETIGAGYRISEDILYEQWQKFCFNCCVNQISGITGLTFGEMRTSAKCIEAIKNICSEISSVGKAEGIRNSDKFYESTLKSLDIMLPEGKTSMLQDIESGIKPEIDIFGGTVIKLGEKHNIDTPYNKILSELLECKTVRF